jgi:hypothetical protein
MNKIPCIKNKCILYPICMNKSFIECTILLKWMWRHDITDEKGFGKMKKYLKKIESVGISKGDVTLL